MEKLFAKLLLELLEQVVEELKSGAIEETDDMALIRRAKIEARAEWVVQVIKSKSTQ